MKHIILNWTIMVMLSSCLATREFHTDFDYSYRAKFKKYKTFSFFVVNDKDSSNFNPGVDRVINNRLKSQGFQYADDSDLLIGYKIFFDEFKFRGYNQPNFDEWLVNSQRVEVVNASYEEETPEEQEKNEDEEYNKVRYNMREGTLLVCFFDRKRNITVWQGYASGLFASAGPSNHRILQSATHRIMDRFRVISRN